MIEISNTGERILLEKETPLMIARHLYAYRFVKDYVQGKAVLDIGCGEGYGTHYLSGDVKSITGIDYDPAVISYAASKYQQHNLSFKICDIKELSSLSIRFDVICCFQVIEHIPDTHAFLKNVRNLLNEGGIFICSTPNKLDASPGSLEPANKFHVKEYLVDEFNCLLKKHFTRIEMFGLKRGKKLNFYRRLKKAGLFNFFPAGLDPVKKFYKKIDTANFIITKDNLKATLDFIAVCRK